MTVGYKKIQLNIPINHFLKFWDKYTKNNGYFEKILLNYFTQQGPSEKGSGFER